MKATKELKWLRGSEMKFTGYKLTGVWGMFGSQTRHHWFGIKGVFGLRYSITWGYYF